MWRFWTLEILDSADPELWRETLKSADSGFCTLETLESLEILDSGDFELCNLESDDSGPWKLWALEFWRVWHLETLISGDYSALCIFWRLWKLWPLETLEIIDSVLRLVTLVTLETLETLNFRDSEFCNNLETLDDSGDSECWGSWTLETLDCEDSGHWRFWIL